MALSSPVLAAPALATPCRCSSRWPAGTLRCGLTSPRSRPRQRTIWP